MPFGALSEVSLSLKPPGQLATDYQEKVLLIKFLTS